MVGKCEVKVTNIRLGVKEGLIMIGTWYKKIKRFKDGLLNVLGTVLLARGVLKLRIKLKVIVEMLKRC